MGYSLDHVSVFHKDNFNTTRYRAANLLTYAAGLDCYNEYDEASLKRLNAAREELSAALFTPANDITKERLAHIEREFIALAKLPWPLNDPETLKKAARAHKGKYTVAECRQLAINALKQALELRNNMEVCEYYSCQMIGKTTSSFYHRLHLRQVDIYIKQIMALTYPNYGPQIVNVIGIVLEIEKCISEKKKINDPGRWSFRSSKAAAAYMAQNESISVNK